MYHDEQKAAGVTLSPKASFILGLVGGMLVLCTIGFFILLSMVLSGNGLSLGSGAKGGNSDYAVAPSPAPAAAAPAPDQGAPSVGEVKPIDKTDHVMGATNPEVTLYEWSDFQCPFCQRYHPTMLQLMADPAYKGKLRWVYRHFPLSFHPNAMPAANASECASEQGKFWEYADELFKNQDSESDAFYGQLADKLKLNRAKFDSCYAAKKYQAKITADQAAGTTAGITGTPGTIIVGKNGAKQLVPGAVPYEQLKAMVDQALSGK
ncbi:MAG TPA: thioredoxin domain-containing protein [Candidatus Binatia bacterium]|jgi:protein-disulfide isomerase|nr:thioredoxin domain-containing protein [Candidatus Binatia bacterium]